MSVGHQDGDVQGQWIYKSRMEERVLAREIHLGVVSIFMNFKLLSLALAGMAQWIECWLASQRVTGLILGQGTCLSFR